MYALFLFIEHPFSVPFVAERTMSAVEYCHITTLFGVLLEANIKILSDIGILCLRSAAAYWRTRLQTLQKESAKDKKEEKRPDLSNE